MGEISKIFSRQKSFIKDVFDGGKDEGQQLRKLSPKKTGDGKQCVIVVGSTGTGKSSTIAKCTGMPIRTGDGTHSVTKANTVYSCGNDPDLLWVDTVGWDDLEGDDVEIFQSILELLHRHGISYVLAVIWTIHPGSIRHDSTLNNQAKLLNQFSDKKIWNNVIIICKQAMNAEQEGAGALKAAYEHNNLSKVQVIGYRYLTDPTLDDSQRSLFENDIGIRKKLNVLDDSQVRDLIFAKIETIAAPIQIIYDDYQCTACGVEGDRRLLPQYCHMEKTMRHSQPLQKFHPKGSSLYHPTGNRIFEHPGRLKNPCCSPLLCFMKKPVPRYTCCKGHPEDKGCVEKWACCKYKLQEIGCQRRYNCCYQDLNSNSEGCELRYACCGGGLRSEGCIAICKKCDKPWGTQAKKCFKTQHRLIEKSSSTAVYC